MGSLHINANKEDVAKIVLMPGDPLRAKFLAESFLDNVKQICNVRNMLGFTGYTKNKHKKISIIASGMGMASIGIYSYELFTYYDVDIIIRLGTCGSYQPELDYYDIIVATSAITDSNWGNTCNEKKDVYIEQSDSKLSDLFKGIRLDGSKLIFGQVLSSDIFYDEDPNYYKKWQNNGVLAVEMESFALFKTATRCHKKALSLLTITDSFTKSENEQMHLTSDDREKKVNKMASIAIDVLEKYF